MQIKTMDEIRSLERPESALPGPIRRTALHDTLVNRLRDMIIEGHLSPGTRLNEGQLGQMLGVSRTPLREAIKYLASEGLVELVPSRGAVVKRFGAKDVQDMARRYLDPEKRVEIDALPKDAQ